MADIELCIAGLLALLWSAFQQYQLKQLTKELDLITYEEQ